LLKASFREHAAPAGVEHDATRNTKHQQIPARIKMSPAEDRNALNA